MARNSRQKVPKSDFQNQKYAPRLIFFYKNFFYKDSDDFWRWKLTLKVRFWHFLTAIFGHLTSLMKKSNAFLWSVRSYLQLQSEMFLSNSVDVMKNLPLVDELFVPATQQASILLYWRLTDFRWMVAWTVAQLCEAPPSSKHARLPET